MMIRRAIGLILSLTLMVTGTATLVYLLFFSPGWQGWMLMAAGGVGIAGFMWLYSDFLDATPNEERDEENSN